MLHDVFKITAIIPGLAQIPYPPKKSLEVLNISLIFLNLWAHTHNHIYNHNHSHSHSHNQKHVFHSGIQRGTEFCNVKELRDSLIL